MTPRGIRLNNPTNVEHSSRNDWDGMTPEQPDPKYVQFVAPEWGIRATVRIFRTYRRRGLTTIRQIIGAWAPPEDDNPTDQYVANVAHAAGIGPDVAVVFPQDLEGMLVGMVQQEQGQQPYPAAVFERGITMGMS